MIESLVPFLNSIVGLVVVLSIVVFIHEYGHYIFAIKCGVKVEEFSVGFGKEIWGKTDKRGTRWKVCWVPLGGFCKFFGDDDAASTKQSKIKELSEEDKQNTLLYKNIWQRIAVVIGGPLFNFIFAIFIFTLFFNIRGIQRFEPIVASLVENSPAEKVGILPNDKVIKFNNRNIKKFSEIQEELLLNTKTNVDLVIERNGEKIIFQISPEKKQSKDTFGNDIETSAIGIISKKSKFQKLNIFYASVEAVKYTYNLSASTLKALGQMIIGQRSLKQLGGPIKIAKYSGKSMKNGFASLFWFVALISANLGLMNLLPIPALDGGHLFFYIVEIARGGKSISEKNQERALKVGFSILITLMIFSTLNDTFSLFLSVK